MASLFFYDLLPPFPADPLDVQINSLPSGHVSFFFCRCLLARTVTYILCGSLSHRRLSEEPSGPPKKTKDFAVLGAFFAGAALR